MKTRDILGFVAMGIGMLLIFAPMYYVVLVTGEGTTLSIMRWSSAIMVGGATLFISGMTYLLVKK